MALSYTSPIFQQVNSPAIDIRRMISGLIASEGVVAATDMAVAQRAAGANMSVDIAAGQAYVQGDAISTQGNYYVLNDAVVNLTGFTAAHATLPRIDRVCLRVRDAFHGDAANDLAFVVVTGTATSGATLVNLTGAAAVPASQLLLANILIPATATTITTANIDTTVRPRLSVGGVVPGPVVLYDSTLGSPAATFDTGAGGFATTYGKLELNLYAAGSTAATEVGVTMQFNADTGANYDFVSTQILNSTAVSVSGQGAAATSIGVMSMPGTSAPSGSFGVSTWELPNYGGTVGHKTGTGKGGLIRGTASTDQLSMINIGRWRSTAAINRVVVTTASGNFITGSRFRVIGHP